MPEPQSFEVEIVHADGTIEKKNAVTHGGPADEKWLEEHLRTGRNPDAKSITVRHAAKDLSGDAAAVVRQHGQAKLADHLAAASPAATTTPSPAATAK